MGRLRQREKPGAKLTRTLAHDPRCYRHKHHRFGTLTAPRTSGPVFFARSQRLDSALHHGDVFAEYEKVVRRPRFRRVENVINAALQTIRENGFWVRPTETVRACADPDDDIFLECAQVARAAYLV